MLLREKDRQSLIEIFQSINIPIEVWAYGSRVNGTAHSGSNLDLVVRGELLMPIPSTVYSALCERITDSNIPILVDLSDWARLPETFQRNIIQKFEVLYSNIINKD